MFLKKILQTTISDKKIAAAIVFYVIFLLTYWSYNSQFYHTNEGFDQNIYFTIGKSIFQGKTLYLDLFDHKGPVIFFIYGFASLISYDSFYGVFLIEILCWSLMILAVYRIAKSYLNRGFAYLVALIFPFFLPHFMQSGGTPEEFILAFECISLSFFVSYFKEKEATVHKPNIMLVHGFLFSLTFFSKFNLALFWVFPVAAVFLNLLLKKAFRNFAWNLLAFLGGFLLVAVPICAYFFAKHAFDEFYFTYFELNLTYSKIESMGKSMQCLLDNLNKLYPRPFELFLLPLSGIFYFPFKYIHHPVGKWAMLLAGISVYVAIFISPLFVTYYPIPFLAFSALGFIALFAHISRYITGFHPFTTKYFAVMFLFLFYLGTELKDISDIKMLDSQKEKPGSYAQNIQKEILKEENPTLITPTAGISLFTTCRIVPNVCYFFSPFIWYESYPVIRDEQTRYIENKDVQFVILLFQSYNKSNKWKSSGTSGFRQAAYTYFTTLPAFRENYEFCARDTVINTIDYNSIEIYDLYKRKD